MKPGDLIWISGQTCPMYPDDISDATGNHWNTKSHIGYAQTGSVGVFLGSQAVSGSRALTFCRILMPGHGPVWVRDAWVKVVDPETR